VNIVVYLLIWCDKELNIIYIEALLFSISMCYLENMVNEQKWPARIKMRRCDGLPPIQTDISGNEINLVSAADPNRS
jgi:hypothetical protein